MQLQLLRLRHLLGWGQDLLLLRYRMHMNILWMRLIPISLLMGTVVPFAGFWSENKRIEILPNQSYALLSNLSYVYSLGAIAFVLLLISRLYLRRLFQSAEEAGLETITGECYAAFPDAPLRLFVKIGPTPGAAKWYVMPLEWDTLITQNAELLEFEAYSATGYVTKLLRVGPRRSDLSSQSELEQAPVEAIKRDAATPTMRRYVRRVWLRGWGVPPRVVYWSGLGALFLFIMLGAFPFSLFLVPLLTPTETYRDALIGFLELSPITLCGFLILIWSIFLLRTGRRGRRARNEPSISTEGIVAVAIERRDPFCKFNRSSLYVELDADDGMSPIFRIPTEFAHRTPLESRVRITYTPATEVVTNVTLLEPEEIAL